jgi:ABC-type tungstate transport system permease subunit
MTHLALDRSSQFAINQTVSRLFSNAALAIAQFRVDGQQLFFPNASSEGS